MLQILFNIFRKILIEQVKNLFVVLIFILLLHFIYLSNKKNGDVGERMIISVQKQRHKCYLIRDIRNNCNAGLLYFSLFTSLVHNKVDACRATWFQKRKEYMSAVQTSLGFTTKLSPAPRMESSQ